MLSSQSDGTVQLNFVSLRDDKPLGFSFTQEGGGTVTIGCEDMELAGQIVQDLCAHLQVAHITNCSFVY